MTPSLDSAHSLTGHHMSRIQSPHKGVALFDMTAVCFLRPLQDPCERAVATSAAWPDSLCGNMDGACNLVELKYIVFLFRSACSKRHVAVQPLAVAAGRQPVLAAVLSQQVAHGSFVCQRSDGLRLFFFSTCRRVRGVGIQKAGAKHLPSQHKVCLWVLLGKAPPHTLCHNLVVPMNEGVLCTV